MGLAFRVIAVVSLVVTAGFVFLVGKKRTLNQLTPLASLAFALVIAGVLFAERRWLGYSLMGAGILAAVLDIVHRSAVR
ncbi:MAG: hypothetical protein GX557_04860 [Chloroflexi bacterium]|nr:hypothetical protein [Chloroflexota bacterium]